MMPPDIAATVAAAAARIAAADAVCRAAVAVRCPLCRRDPGRPCRGSAARTDGRPPRSHAVRYTASR